MARPRGHVRRSGSVRKMLWIPLAPADITQAGNGDATLTHTLNTAALALRPFTVIRSHVSYMLRSDQAAAIELQFLAAGLAVVSDQANDIGITALPEPSTDAASSLFFTHVFMMADESNLTDRTRPSTKFQLDSKAMRKVPAGSNIVHVIEGMGLGNGSITTIAGRMLVKLN